MNYILKMNYKETRMLIQKKYAIPREIHDNDNAIQKLKPYWMRIGRQRKKTKEIKDNQKIS